LKYEQETSSNRHLGTYKIR